MVWIKKRRSDQRKLQEQRGRKSRNLTCSSSAPSPSRRLTLPALFCYLDWYSHKPLQGWSSKVDKSRNQWQEAYKKTRCLYKAMKKCREDSIFRHCSRGNSMARAWQARSLHPHHASKQSARLLLPVLIFVKRKELRQQESAMQFRCHMTKKYVPFLTLSILFATSSGCKRVLSWIDVAVATETSKAT